METLKGRPLGEFHEALRDYLDKKISETEFKNRRTLWGLHRSLDGSFMLRFRFGAGGLTAFQARQVSRFIRRWVPSGRAHITTRRNLQVYDIALESMGKALEDANWGELSTYQAGGAVVRSLAMCERAGYCLDQVADPRPLSIALEEWLENNAMALPRKVKVAFSGCGRDCAFTIAHDFGLVAVRNAQGELGYRFLVGGGLGSQPHLAKEMEAFVPEKEAGPLLVAAIMAFRKLGAGRPRVKARLKFLLDEIGVEPFRKAVYETKASNFPKPRPIQPEWDDAAQCCSDGGQGDFLKWKKSNVLPTLYPQRFSVTVKVAGGWVSGRQLELMAETADFFSNGRFNLTSEQNILFPAVSGAALVSIYKKLQAIGLEKEGAGRIGDFTSCPGKDYCRGAQGYGLASELEGPLEEAVGKLPEEAREGTVKVSGCLNQCGRSALASLGLAGDWKQEAEGPKRIVHLFLGGGVYEKGSRMARYAGWIPLDRIGTFLLEFSGDFSKQRKEGETFRDYCLRISKDPTSLLAKGIVRDENAINQAGIQFEGEC
jgi:sulfite reductase beta subunit-like hemoprotein